MSTKEFWEEEPDLFWAYRFSFYNKTLKEQDLLNTNAWLQGAYIYEAVSVALQNSFSSTKGTYSSKPWELNKNENKDEEKNNFDVDEIKARVAQVKSIFKNKEK